MKLTLNNALEAFKKSKDEEISVGLMFYVDKEGKSVKVKQTGKPYETIVTLDYLKQHFIDEVIGKILEETKKGNYNKEIIN